MKAIKKSTKLFKDIIKKDKCIKECINIFLNLGYEFYLYDRGLVYAVRVTINGKEFDYIPKTGKWQEVLYSEYKWETSNSVINFVSAVKDREKKGEVELVQDSKVLKKLDRLFNRNYVPFRFKFIKEVKK